MKPIEPIAYLWLFFCYAAALACAAGESLAHSLGTELVLFVATLAWLHLGGSPFRRRA